MRIKKIGFILLAVIINGCASPHYLPSSENIGISPYGSNIEISRKEASDINGELIAIDENQIYVLADSESKCITVPLSKVRRFRLRYARPKHYGWTIPLFTLATISHGYFLIITAPLNLIVTVAVTVSGENSFVYNNRKITYEELKMFARYPQGIPQNIDIAKIK
jgi:hypothetical protein